MNNRYYFIVLCCGLFMAGGCNKYLEVQPEASYTDNQVYSNANALQQALNGIYLDMADKTFYGAYMSNTIVELLAQRYKPVTDLMGIRNLNVISSYQYAAPAAQAIFDTIWRKGYSTILATNVFLSKIDNSIQAKVVSQDNGNQLKGEALAIRAMIHLDLLRLYGPVYSSGSASAAIPYYTAADAKLQPILTASQVIEKVIADLNQASQLLAKDPVTTTGVLYTSDFYSGYRNQRLNYYAVKGLMARAYMWSGQKELARTTSLAVLNEGEKWFPSTTFEAARDLVNPDRVFSTEVMFGVYNPAMYTLYNTYFSPSVYDGAILVPDSLRLKAVFESNENDYRYPSTWKILGKPYRTFYKYADDIYSNKPWRFLQPLLRKSELYYILAETETDPVKALDYLNTARRRRGLVALDNTANIPTELRKEYQKEFFGEGQLFFYYKRIKATGVPNGADNYSWSTVDPVYAIPLPLSETTTR